LRQVFCWCLYIFLGPQAAHAQAPFDRSELERLLISAQPNSAATEISSLGEAPPSSEPGVGVLPAPPGIPASIVSPPQSGLDVISEMGCAISIEDQQAVLSDLDAQLTAYEQTMEALRPRARGILDMLSRPSESNYCSEENRAEIDEIIQILMQLPTGALEVTAIDAMDCAVSDFRLLQVRKNEAASANDNIMLQRLSVREGRLVTLNGTATGWVERAIGMRREVGRYSEGMANAQALCTPLDL